MAAVHRSLQSVGSSSGCHFAPRHLPEWSRRVFTRTLSTASERKTDPSKSPPPPPPMPPHPPPLPSPPPFPLQTSKIREQDPLNQIRSSRFALLIDGDVTGVTDVPAILAVVRARGVVAHAMFFAAACPPRSRAALRELGVEFVAVPRRGGGLKDPNDMAIGMEAGRLASGSDRCSIALCVGDVDFVYLAEWLGSRGCAVVVVMERGTRIALARAFRTAGAQIVPYTPADGGRQLPKQCAVLHTSGDSTFEPFTNLVDSNTLVDVDVLRPLLRQSACLVDDTDPIVPAIAKYYHANEIGPLRIWPDVHCMYQAIGELDVGKRCRWQSGSLAFVSPRGTTGNRNKAIVETYGTAACCAVVTGGGPFIVLDTDDMVEKVLARMGYLDSNYNSSVEEAVDVFCLSGMNNKGLNLLGLRYDPAMSGPARKALLRSALVSHKSPSVWRVAPSDKLVRDHFAKEGLLASANAPPNQMFEALERFLVRHCKPVRRTSNGRLADVLRHLAKNNPQLRK